MNKLFAGFGDKFPGASVGNDKEAQEKLVITSIYLLFGMALLAMSFNLAQEEVVCFILTHRSTYLRNIDFTGE